MTPAVLLVGVLGGMVAVLMLGFVVTRITGVRNGLVVIRQPDSAARVTGALAIALVVAVLVGTALGVARGGTDFASSGLQRYLTAPLVYGTFLLVVLATIARLVPSWPIWVPYLLVAVTVSTVVSPLAGRFSVGSLLQGLTLLAGAAVFALAGLLQSDWRPYQRRRLLRVVLGIGAAAGLLALQTGIFSALVLPAAAALLFLVRDRPRGWPLAVVAGIAVVVLSQIRNAEAVDPSAASTGQLLLAVAVFGLALLPPKARLGLVVVLVVGGLIAALQSDVPGLLIGRGADLPDVTLAQRAYETQEVFREASANPFTLFFGAGPGATVDLSAGPDAATLLASGRDLQAVPTVHLLTSYVALKLGFFGLGWLAVFVGSALVAAVRVLSQPRPDYFDLVLVTLVLTGIVQALPAATFLFSNPLPVLCLAILHVRQTSADRADDLSGSLAPRHLLVGAGPIVLR